MFSFKDSLWNIIDFTKIANKEENSENMIKVTNEDGKTFHYGGLNLLKSMVGLPYDLPLFKDIKSGRPKLEFRDFFENNYDFDIDNIAISGAGDVAISSGNTAHIYLAGQSFKHSPCKVSILKGELAFSVDSRELLVNSQRVAIKNEKEIWTQDVENKIVDILDEEGFYHHKAYPNIRYLNAHDLKNSNSPRFFLGKIEDGHFKASIKKKNKSHSAISANGKYFLTGDYKHSINIYKIIASKEDIELDRFYEVSIAEIFRTDLKQSLAIGENGRIFMALSIQSLLKVYYCNPPVLEEFFWRERALLELLMGPLGIKNIDPAILTNAIIAKDLVRDEIKIHFKNPHELRLYLLKTLDKISDQFANDPIFLAPDYRFRKVLTVNTDEKIQDFIRAISAEYYGSHHKNYIANNLSIKLCDNYWSFIIESFTADQISEIIKRYHLKPGEIELPPL